MNRPIVAIDFDGVIHSYEKGWQDGSIYGTFTPGFIAWAIEANSHFNLYVISSRLKSPEDISKVKTWMNVQLAERMMPDEASKFVAMFTFSTERPPAWVTIDDRALTFRGAWSEFSPGFLKAFKPWNVNEH